MTHMLSAPHAGLTFWPPTRWLLWPPCSQSPRRPASLRRARTTARAGCSHHVSRDSTKRKYSPRRFRAADVLDAHCWAFRGNDATLQAASAPPLRVAAMRTALWAAALLLCVQRSNAVALLNGSVGAGSEAGVPGDAIAVVVVELPSDSASSGTVNASSTDSAPGPLGGPLLPKVLPVDVLMMFDEPAAAGSSAHIPRSAGPLMEGTLQAGSVKRSNTLAKTRVTGSW